MAHRSCFTVCIGVLRTVSGQKMTRSSGLTVCIGVLATVSGQQMALSSGLYSCFIDYIRTANGAIFWFVNCIGVLTKI